MSYADLYKKIELEAAQYPQFEIPVKEFIEKELTLLGFEVIQRATKLADLAEERTKSGEGLSCDEKQAFREEIRLAFEETQNELERILPLLRRNDRPAIVIDSPILTNEERQDKKYHTLNLVSPNEKEEVPKEDWAPFQIVAFPKETIICFFSHRLLPKSPIA